MTEVKLSTWNDVFLGTVGPFVTVLSSVAFDTVLTSVEVINSHVISVIDGYIDEVGSG